MKVLLVNGSPHKDGCTYTALSEVEKTLNEEGIETEIYWVGIKPIGGCMACNQCKDSGKCIYDDVVNEFIEKAKDVDGFIFGTPVHYAAASGSVTGFMDRAFYAGSRREKNIFALKPAAAVISARRAGTTSTYDQLNKYFGISQMPIISSRYWNMVHGNTPDEVRRDEEGMQVMRMLGRNMAYYLKCVEAGREKGIETPKQEEVIIKTNYIR